MCIQHTAFVDRLDNDHDQVNSEVGIQIFSTTGGCLLQS